MLAKLINLSRLNKKLVILGVDSVVTVLVLLASFSIRLEYLFLPDGDLIWLVLGAPIIAIPVFVHFGLYHTLIRYIGFKALWSVVQAASLYALLWGVIGFMARVDGIPRSVVLINWLLIIVALGGTRMLARWLLSGADNRDNYVESANVVIYGAGSAGRQLSIALTQTSEYKTVAFIDNDAALLGQYIHGIRVFLRDDLESLIKTKNVTEVLLAIPSLTRPERNEIIHFLEPYAVLVRSLPSVAELAKGKLRIADLRDVSIKDLLGRDSVAPSSELLGLNIANKVVMVTGAGGSIGAELCRQILALKPQVLVLFDQSEFALYRIHKELINVGIPNVKILPMLGSVTNRKRLSHILGRFDVNTIYHAAAFKHVPMVESNNTEGVSNNVFGTLNCAQFAIDHGVDTFVLISTDKAVRPTNTMGATKRVAELILQSLAVINSTRFSMVRFGNVLDSSGSVVPLFREQIKGGGPVTVTDPEILRYFMSIPEAVELVIQAGAMAKGGDVFVLDMGKPVRILDLAKKMIHLSGLRLKDKLNPNGDIEIKFTGLRPGEKLYEELLISGNVSKTDNPMIMRAEEEMLAWDDLKLILDELELAVDSGDQGKLRQLLIRAVPGFKPQSDITDILYEA
ncbi:nucleoside-diphosphate sugar epimerase/dehydratase [Candidatus Pseudothioglobus singularis]|nr:nucleoside-diphosphate sugar epimerase/dehydratase [Candidatus Pseudothioglobus singularis]